MPNPDQYLFGYPDLEDLIGEVDYYDHEESDATHL